MSRPQEPLEITLEFSSTRERAPSEVFAWQEEKYRVLHTDEDGTVNGGIVPFSWNEPWLRPALDAMDNISPSSEVLIRLGQCVRGLLRLTNWARFEHQIERALDARRPVHLTIRSLQANELYYLPWELLPLSRENRFVGMEDCLLQYECLESRSEAPPTRTENRILFAYANAGNRVPAETHHQAIRSACAKTTVSPSPSLDVLHEANRMSLVEKLSDQERPVTALHLLCHGVRVSNTAYGLMFGALEPSSIGEALDVDMLKDLLGPALRARPPRLVTLCACGGGDAGTPAHLLGSVARMFHEQGVPAVIASRMPLSAEGSNLLTETLYEELLGPHGNLRMALCAVRKKLREKQCTRDWISLQLYARGGDRAALYPFREPPPIPPKGAPNRELVLICHEAYKKASVVPENSDAPTLFAGRTPKRVDIDQTRALRRRDWSKLETEVRRLTSDDGELMGAFDARGTDVVYYGFPYIPLAVLAGYLAKNRPVHVLEYISNEFISNRFTWESSSNVPYLPLNLEVQHRETGSAARLRISVSADVKLDDCRQVLPDEEVRLDLHFSLETQKQGSVRREDQLKAYVQAIQDALSQYILSKSPIKSLHIFAAIPVSLAFHLGDALTRPATWLPDCFVYNFGQDEQPRYKWRLDLRAADRHQDSIRIFE